MISEIKRRFANGEDVELECIDVARFKSKNPFNEKILQLKSIVAYSYQVKVFFDSAEGVGLRLTDTDGEKLGLNSSTAFITKDELQYFKIKENKKTFHDLVDVAVQAKKDGIIYSVDWDSSLTVKVSSHRAPIVIVCEKVSGDFIEEAIKSIKSLYTETFIIEGNDDIERVNVGAHIELTNGNNDQVLYKSTYKGAPMIQFSNNKHWGALGLFILKGAKVTQKKGGEA